MTLGELADKLAQLHRAKQEVAAAELAIHHGGNADTMRRKNEILSSAKEYVEYLRDQEIEF